MQATWTLSDVDRAWLGWIAEREPALASIIDAAGLAHGKGLQSELVMRAVRLLEMKRLLKPTGSLYRVAIPRPATRRVPREEPIT